MITNPDGSIIAALAAANPLRYHGTKTLINKVYNAELKNMHKDTFVASYWLYSVIVSGAW